MKANQPPPHRRSPRSAPKVGAGGVEQRDQRATTTLDMLHNVPGRGLYERVKRLIELPPYDEIDFPVDPSSGGQNNAKDEPGDDDEEEEEEEEEEGDGLWGGTAIEPTVEPRTLVRNAADPDRTTTTVGSNWMEQFLRRTSNERIRWQTKYYCTDRKLLDKPLFQQIEELIDLGAQDFSEWLNGLGAEKSNITKDIIKQLFSIEIEEEIARAIRVETREVRAIPTEAARHWQLDHMALQRRITQVMRADQRAARRAREHHVAFGRTLPRELRTGAGAGAGAGTGADHRDPDGDTILPDFPDDLRTLKALFKDIRHLRSVRYLIEHLQHRTDIQRPRYLVEQGLFAQHANQGQRQRQNQASPAFYRLVLTNRMLLDSVQRQ
ncbi:uncharacterized protein LOC126574563 [Anopheles aquasalis]|uniref:uncharacterized protein LOC126574563 n=1 Tax=Anopheles aquasalis TaxID=42839 RepID=UPI00215B38A9|nr:uncharacterized protein LOC126574563 [Anopheles aquasalis]